MITEGLLRGESSPDEVEPEDDLTELDVGGISQAHDHDADAVGIADEEVVRDVVRLVARELPHAHLTHACSSTMPPQNMTKMQAITATSHRVPVTSKSKGSPYSITERMVTELIPVLGSQTAGDVSHKPGSTLPLFSARLAVTLAPSQPLRGLLQISLLGEQRHDGCEPH